MSPSMPREAYQDGPDFYDVKGALIASFPELVNGDADFQGAALARYEFRRRFPDTKLVSGFEGGES